MHLTNTIVAFYDKKFTSDFFAAQVCGLSTKSTMPSILDKFLKRAQNLQTKIIRGEEGDHYQLDDTKFSKNLFFQFKNPEYEQEFLKMFYGRYLRFTLTLIVAIIFWAAGFYQAIVTIPLPPALFYTQLLIRIPLGFFEFGFVILLCCTCFNKRPVLVETTFVILAYTIVVVSTFRNAILFKTDSVC